MTKKANFKNRILSSALVICLLTCVLSSCGSKPVTGVKSTGSVSARNVISQPSERVENVHYSGSAKSFEDTGIASGFIELWVDPDTCSLGVYDNSADVLWSALPMRSYIHEGSYGASDASMVTLKIIGGTDIYLLNSQDNSVEYGTSAMAEKDGVYHFSYSIFDSEATAKKSSYSTDDIGFRVELGVKLKDGNMTIDCSYENLTGNKNAYIEELELLNYFGAYNDASKDNFIFVPDGCGAIIDTSVYDDSFESLSFSVYGDDLSNPSGTDGSAIVPAFGIKKDNAAFVSLIEYGDAVSTLHADKATDYTGYNRVYSSFNITPSAYENETLYISKSPTVKTVSLCYRFLSASNATYAGMASAIREQLIRNGVLSTRTIDRTDYLPFYVTLTGTVKKEFSILKYTGTLTDFEQAQDMLVRMKNKGINNVSIRYCSIFSGGGDSKDIKKAGVLRRLGGNSGFEELQQYTSGQNMKLYADINILSSAESFGSDDTYSIYNQVNLCSDTDPLTESAGSESKPRSFRKISGLKSAVISILSEFKNYSSAGICLDDAGRYLYSDFSANGMLRQDSSQTIASTISPLSTANGIMIVNGNFYMLKNVDSVIELPLTTSVPKTGSYTPVPFVQLILHGIADYSGEAINEQENKDEVLLRYIEYGACPYYKWNYTPITGNSENDIYYYDNTINEAAEFYSDATGVLNSLRDARMTDHYEVTDGVFCTEYDTGTMIYVNYTDDDCTVLGSVVEAGSFLQVN